MRRWDICRYAMAGVACLAFVGVAVAGKEASVSPTPVGFFLEAHHIFLLILAAVIVLALGGKNLADLVRGLIGKGGDVTVNLDGCKEGHCPVLAGAVPINPDLCPDCKAEKERSLRNERHVGELFGKVEGLKDDLNEGIQRISSEIGTMKTEIIKALAANRR
jgi:hypothetical protein